FLSSRRRHTRSKRDWSSDVCSSDLQCRWSCSPPPAVVTPVGGRYPPLLSTVDAWIPAPSPTPASLPRPPPRTCPGHRVPAPGELASTLLLPGTLGLGCRSGCGCCCRRSCSFPRPPPASC